MLLEVEVSADVISTQEKRGERDLRHKKKGEREINCVEGKLSYRRLIAVASQWNLSDVSSACKVEHERAARPTIL